MDVTTLGRTGLQVSRMGLGCGGHSRLGLSNGNTEAEAERVVREALSLGVNFIDTAEAYGTEEVVGRALAAAGRDRTILSTKAGVRWKDRRTTRAELKERVEASLARLQTGYVDLFHLHGVAADDYSYAREELVPALRELQEAGKVRFLGITEAFASDPSHRMLSQAVQDDCWDVMMVGFNLLNPSARERVLARTQEQNVGTLCMFAVRRALSRPEALKAALQDLVAKGQVPAGSFDADDPLGFLMTEGGAESLPEAAYRFCRWEPGIDVVLSGTGRVEHLKENAASLNRPALPPAVLERLNRLFGQVDSVSGN
ncbi:MAG: aldo/keto reductase [Armatimonadetes bacterium]|nr:aldo/keto reductase [Armatimonadota bacterium]